jgi:hypothetical protein
MKRLPTEAAVAPRKCGAYFLLVGSAISGFPGAGFTAELLPGILSRPWSPLSSLPPEVDVPLPLFVGLMPDLSGLAFCELAAGSPVVAPLPVALPCADTAVPDRTRTAANAIV